LAAFQNICLLEYLGDLFESHH